MSKPSSNLGRPSSAGSKSPSLRRELQGNRSCMLRIGERLMRAGSEGNLVQRPIPARSQSHTSSAGLGQKSNGQTQAQALEDKPSEHAGSNSNKDPGTSLSRVSSSSSAVDRSTSRDRNQSEVERKKEVFLDHLRQKYPHHVAIIMGHQDHVGEQVRFEAVLVEC
ncbi:sickle tail protein-like [Trachinotus anak]|uniref:sickle tail protein-like n=1 Tax=Trachinotus anak TaxID=443729 RepID=UPI0039F25621